MKIYRLVLSIFLFLTLVNLSYATEITFAINATNDNVIGYQTNNQQKLAQTFTGNNENIVSVALYYAKGGSPTDNVVILIQGDVLGGPSNITLGGGSFSASDINDTTGHADYYRNLTLNTTIYTESSKTYWIILERSGALDISNYAYVSDATPSQYSGGSFYTYVSSPSPSWSSVSSGTYDIKGSAFTQPNVTIELKISTNLTNNTYTNSSSLSIFTNVTNISTNGNVNTTLYLNNGSSYQIGTNQLNSTYNLTGIQEGAYNIWFNATNGETSVLSTNYTYYFQFTSPNVTNNLASVITQYNINLSANISYNSVIPIQYCYFNLSNGQSDLCNSSSFTFNSTGNLTYNIEAKDLAGNTNLISSSVYVNPKQCLSFNDSVRNILLSDYTLNNTHFSLEDTYTSCGLLYNIGIGNHDILFTKFGYNNYSFTLSLNSLSDINTTYNVTPVNLSLQVYDEEVPTRQLTFNLTIFNSTLIQSYTNQVNFSSFYNETPTGEITLVITSNDYNQTYCERRLYTDLTTSAAISLTAYLLPNTSCYPVIFQILDIRQTQGINNAILTFSILKNDTTYNVGQAETDSRGATYFNLDPNIQYTVTITKDGYVTSTLNTLPNVLSYTLTLPQIQIGGNNAFLGLISYIRPSNTQQTIPLTVYGYTLDTENLLGLTYFTVTSSNGTIVYSNYSTNSGGANLSFTITENATYYNLNLTVLRNGTYNTLWKQIQIVNESGFTNTTIIDLGQTLEDTEDTGDRVFIMLLLVVIFMLIGGFISTVLGVSSSIAVISSFLPLFFFGSVGWLLWNVVILFVIIGMVLVAYLERLF